MEEIKPCPVCGGRLEASAYDRSCGQVSCVGECESVFRADAVARLADAAALLRAVEGLNESDALTGLHRTNSRSWRLNTTAHVAEADTLAAALIALAARLEAK